VGQLRTALAFGRRLFWAPRCGRKTLGLREIMIRYVICCVALFASGALAQSGSGKLTALGVWRVADQVSRQDCDLQRSISG
jgi:hypothetical protein